MKERALQPNTTLCVGKYKIVRMLKQGGFGITYLAIDQTFDDEEVAIKEFFLRGVTERVDVSQVSVSNGDSLTLFDAQRKKFKKEAKRLRKIHHPNVIRVRDLFDENGTSYYVMDYIDGEDLQSHVNRNGAMSERVVMDKILPQILEALETVHQQGLLHLDIKPSNIMLSNDDKVTLIDFGSSKQVDKNFGDTTTTPTAISYTEGYAPPEQFEQNLSKFGAWTDFYALGATLYNILTCNKPPRPSDMLDDPTPAKEQTLPMPGVSTRTRDLIIYLMQNRRDLRPQSVREVIGLIVYNVNTIQQPSTNESAYIDPLVSNGSDDATVIEDDNLIPNLESGNVSNSNIDNNKEGSNPNEFARKNNWKKNILSLLCFFAIVVGIIVNYEINNGYINSLPQNTLIQDDKEKKPKDTMIVNDKKMGTHLGKITYSGEVNNSNVPNGKGVAYFDDGRYYKGDFVNGKFEGKATFKYANGDIFVGIFKDNKFHDGKYTIAKDGSYFQGTYQEGKPYKGKWYNKNGTIIEIVN